VMMTPHVSGWTEGMLNARASLIADNIERTARGEPPLNAIALGDCAGVLMRIT
jgi:phosphoglycerate dehydrogenase-like enzyme